MYELPPSSPMPASFTHDTITQRNVVEWVPSRHEGPDVQVGPHMAPSLCMYCSNVWGMPTGARDASRALRPSSSQRWGSSLRLARVLGTKEPERSWMMLSSMMSYRLS